jgi:hypothetical protein
LRETQGGDLRYLRLRRVARCSVLLAVVASIGRAPWFLNQASSAASSSVGAGPSCTPAGIGLRYATRYEVGSGYVVNSVAVTGLDSAAFAGQSFVVRLTGDDRDLGEGTIPVTAGEPNPVVAIRERPAAASVTGAWVTSRMATRAGCGP